MQRDQANFACGFVRGKGMVIMMTKRSLYSCIISLTVLSVYLLLFGFTSEIDGRLLSEDGEISSEEITSEESLSTDEIIASDTLYAPPITKYETSINASNYAKPGFADFPAQTTAPYYYADDIVTESEDYDSEDEIATEAETTAVTEETTTTTEVTTTATTETTTTTTEATTTTTETTTTTTEATTTTEVTTSQTVYEEETAVAPVETESDPLGIKFTVSNSGVNVTDSALNIVSKIVQKEIGSSFETEAIKAQAVASYTFVKMYNDKGAVPSVLLASVVSERVKNAVKEVLGEAVYYNGELIQAVYCSSSAGRTASSGNVWGQDYPYLRSVETEFDTVYDPNYGVKKNITANALMTLIIEKTGITPTGDPSTWLEIINHVDDVYVGNMKISGKTSYSSGGTEIVITGRVFRERIFGISELKSAAFEFTYDDEKEMFTFTTYGYGHGVGLSQNGANILARHEGYDYKDILQFYYSGTEVY